MEDLNSPSTSTTPSGTAGVAVAAAPFEQVDNSQNLFLGAIGGLIGGLIGAVIWALITYFTDYQIGWMAIGVGMLVGFGVRLLGRGHGIVFGLIGGLIALVSVVLGNFLACMGFLSKELGMGLVEMFLNFDYSLTFELLKVTFSPIDILFYAIAVYAGFKAAASK
ncbi:MAG TPA: hypothetical protein PKW33_05425 [Anaerolineaceae bacterium]|nr:hypothetical protein [Anaerolineaceae bacterium]HPN51006.1 hypothetical protein [Anaerolineaceae bacterium]